MATFRIFTGYHLDLGLIGLAPGQSQDTFWLNWQPEPRNGAFTVTVTAHPGTEIAGSNSHAANRLAVSETSVEYVPRLLGDIVLTQLVVHARLLNTGPAAIRYVSLCITFNEL